MASPGGALATEPISGNSLTQFIRSLEGMTGTQGQGALTSGLNQTQSGLNQAQSGVSAAGPALSFLTALTQGSQADVTQATEPQVDAITQQFDAIRNMISLQPRGGGKTSALAEAPFQKSGAIQRMQGDERTKAAGQLGGLATNLAGIGISEAGIGEGMAGIGAGLEGTSANIALGKEGQDYSQASALSQMLSVMNTISGMGSSASQAKYAGLI